LWSRDDVVLLYPKLIAAMPDYTPPLLPPTKTLTRTSSESRRQFSRKPTRIAEGVGVSGCEVMSMAPSILHTARNPG
jgi:hypothetical protein